MLLDKENYAKLKLSNQSRGIVVYVVLPKNSCYEVWLSDSITLAKVYECLTIREALNKACDIVGEP